MKVAQVLSKAARSRAGGSEGVACAGTALESKTFKVSDKAFLFIGPKNARLKLVTSADEAKEWAGKAKSAVEFGKGGWVAIRFDGSKAPADSVLRRWVAESHSLFAGSAK